MPFEKCLHALIFPSETAALPPPQRRRLGSNSEIFTYTPPQKKPYANNTKKSAKQECGLAAHSLSENPRGQQRGFNIGN